MSIIWAYTVSENVFNRFSCFQYNYPELEDHFIQANLSPYNNFWWNVHDFTPVPGQKNWSILGGMYKVTFTFFIDPAL